MPGASPLILVVDGDEPFRVSVLEVLADVGYGGVGVSTAAEALALARQRRPSAVTVDMALSDGPGFELARRLREDPITRTIPIVLLSAHVAWLPEVDKPRFAAMLPKPLEMAALLAVLEDLCGQALWHSSVPPHVAVEPPAPVVRTSTVDPLPVAPVHPPLPPAPRGRPPEEVYPVCLALLEALLARSAAHGWANRVRTEMGTWPRAFRDPVHPLWLPFDQSSFLGLRLDEAHGCRVTAAQEPWVNSVLHELQYYAGESRRLAHLGQSHVPLDAPGLPSYLPAWACVACRQQYLSHADVRRVAASRWARQVVREWMASLQAASLSPEEARDLLDPGFHPTSDAGCTQVVATVTLAAEASRIPFYPTESSGGAGFQASRCPQCRHRADGWVARYWQAPPGGPLVFRPME